MKKTAFVIITGASGSGKTIALKTLEDLGYYAIDNLPAGLLPAFVHLIESGHSDIKRVAMVMDVRGREPFERYGQVIKGLKDAGHEVTVVYLSAATESLMRRFSETRRVHPLDPTVPLAEALGRESAILEPLREAADLFLETSDLGPHDLRRFIRERFGSTETGGRMLLTFVSFGYKFGLPNEADLVFDVRFLPNPFFRDDLRHLDGRDAQVVSFLQAAPGASAMQERIRVFLAELLPLYLQEGRGYLTVAVGCTGGQHRSVAVVENLAARFRDNPLVNVQVRHRELTKE